MASETSPASGLLLKRGAAGSGSQTASEKPTDREKERAMSEDHRIVSQAGAEPLPKGCVGVRVRMQLSGRPSRRWSRDLCARLVNELVGDAAVGQLRLDDIVQGDQIVLEGVEASEAPALGGALRRAVDATNQACIEEHTETANVTQQEADAIASEIVLGCRSVLRSGRSTSDTADVVTPSCWFG
jgi:hypothetical protein